MSGYCIGPTHRLEELDLVDGCLCVVARALDHLERHEGGGQRVPAEPDRGEVSPAKLPHHAVPLLHTPPYSDHFTKALDVLFC